MQSFHDSSALRRAPLHTSRLVFLSHSGLAPAIKMITLREECGTHYLVDDPDTTLRYDLHSERVLAELCGGDQDTIKYTLLDRWTAAVFVPRKEAA